jgi:lathosterol oxidase
MQIASFWINVPALFLIISLRYFLVSWLAHRYFPPIKAPEKNQLRREISYSVLTCLLFALAGALVLEGWKLQWLPIYADFSQGGISYFLLSIAIMIFLHETYFYFTHRLLHLPKLYQKVHRVHHLSKNPTAFASFSFHPMEGLIEAAILPIIFFLVPAHPSALLFFLTFMTVLGATNHLGREIYPASSATHWFGKWWIGPTHHGQHHLRVKGNFGLYFTFWDKLLGTEFPDYAKEFETQIQLRRKAHG